MCLNLLSLPRCLFLLVLLTLVACAAESPSVNHEAAAITINDAWVLQPPPTATVAAAYLRLTNPGSRDERLLTVDTPLAERVEIHDMQVVSGMMQMREVQGGLSLPANETTSLAPGGLHLMLIAPKVELVLGDEVPITLTFEHAPAQTVTFQVRSLMDAEDVPGHGGHHGHHQ